MTDPPELPPGTTNLYLTYSGVSINVTSPSGKSSLFTASFAGTVDLTTLANLTKTIASIAVPAGWQVNSVSLSIQGIRIFVNGTSQGVTPLSNTISLPVSQSFPINSSLTGSILDFSPAVEQLQVVNATSGQVNTAFVFMPGGVALGETNLNSTQATVGNTSNLTANDWGRFHRIGRLYSSDLLVTSSQLSVNGNVTTFSVTLMNNDSVTLPIYGISLAGQFNMTAVHYDCHGKVCHQRVHYKNGDSTVPFWVNGTTLLPVLGSLGQGGFTGGAPYMLGPNHSATFTYKGVIQALKQAHHTYNHIVLTPISGKSYRLAVVGIGRARFNILAT